MYKECMAIVPLANFDSDVDNILLEDGLCLRRFEGNEKEELVKLWSGYETALRVALMDTDFVVEKRLKSSSDFTKWTEKSQNIMNILLALRLLKRGELLPSTAFLIYPNKSYAVTNTSQIGAAFPECYLLKKSEIGKFVKLWEKLRLVKNEKPHLVLALKQFYEPFYNLEEQLAKYMMAFESLVFGRGSNTPRPYGRTIGIAISMLLGKNEKERTKIENVLTEAYELRNKIVHGHLRISKHHEKRTRDLFNQVEDYLRRSLRKFVEE